MSNELLEGKFQGLFEPLLNPLQVAISFAEDKTPDFVDEIDSPDLSITFPLLLLVRLPFDLKSRVNEYHTQKRVVESLTLSIADEKVCLEKLEKDIVLNLEQTLTNEKNDLETLENSICYLSYQAKIAIEQLHRGNIHIETNLLACDWQALAMMVSDIQTLESDIQTLEKEANTLARDLEYNLSERQSIRLLLEELQKRVVRLKEATTYYNLMFNIANQLEPEKCKASGYRFVDMSWNKTTEKPNAKTKNLTPKVTRRQHSDASTFTAFGLLVFSGVAVLFLQGASAEQTLSVGKSLTLDESACTDCNSFFAFSNSSWTNLCRELYNSNFTAFLIAQGSNTTIDGRLMASTGEVCQIFSPSTIWNTTGVDSQNVYYDWATFSGPFIYDQANLCGAILSNVLSVGGFHAIDSNCQNLTVVDSLFDTGEFADSTVLDGVHFVNSTFDVFSTADAITIERAVGFDGVSINRAFFLNGNTNVTLQLEVDNAVFEQSIFRGPFSGYIRNSSLDNPDQIMSFPNGFEYSGDNTYRYSFRGLDGYQNRANAGFATLVYNNTDTFGQLNAVQHAATAETFAKCDTLPVSPTNSSAITCFSGNVDIRSMRCGYGDANEVCLPEQQNASDYPIEFPESCEQALNNHCNDVRPLVTPTPIPHPLPTSTPTSTPDPTPTPHPLPTSTPTSTPNPTPTPHPLPTSTPTSTPNPTPTPHPIPTSTPTSTPDPTPTPTPTPKPRPKPQPHPFPTSTMKPNPQPTPMPNRIPTSIPISIPSSSPSSSPSPSPSPSSDTDIDTDTDKNTKNHFVLKGLVSGVTGFFILLLLLYIIWRVWDRIFNNNENLGHFVRRKLNTQSLNQDNNTSTNSNNNDSEDGANHNSQLNPKGGKKRRKKRNMKSEDKKVPNPALIEIEYGGLESVPSSSESSDLNIDPETIKYSIQAKEKATSPSAVDSEGEDFKLTQKKKKRRKFEFDERGQSSNYESSSDSSSSSAYSSGGESILRALKDPKEKTRSVTDVASDFYTRITSTLTSTPSTATLPSHAVTTPLLAPQVDSSPESHSLSSFRTPRSQLAPGQLFPASNTDPAPSSSSSSSSSFSQTNDGGSNYGSDTSIPEMPVSRGTTYTNLNERSIVNTLFNTFNSVFYNSRTTGPQNTTEEEDRAFDKQL